MQQEQSSEPIEMSTVRYTNPKAPFLRPAIRTVSAAAVIPRIMLAAQAGAPDAQYMLATMYEIGAGVPQNAQEADAWLRKAALSGFRPAIEKLRARRSEADR
ncbi:MAG TPA: SEL1-like repeat protein [Terriglobales bacterium]|nr:SEL1-like repeat protein [Terriglobales bacterium]